MRIHGGKRAAALLLTLTLCFPLGGCAEERSPAPSGPVPESGAETARPQASETPAGKTPAPDKRAAAREVYLDFLHGKGTVTPSEAFRQEEGGYPWNRSACGTYSYQELKYVIAEEIMGDSTAHYTFLDVGGEAELLVLRFENADPSFLNWTGILRYDGETLTLTDAYEDGYRVVGDLFTSGYLCISGAGGAGVYATNGFLVGEDGTARALYESWEYWGGFATSIHYQLEEPRSEPMGDQYFNLSPEFYVRSLFDENGWRACVEYSGDTDPEARALEEAFVNELTERGIRLMDRETFERLFDQARQYGAQRVTWIDLEDGLPSPMG